jgi:hypothetical protein
MPRRPPSEVPVPVEALIWEDAEIMAQVLAGLEADGTPEREAVREWDGESWWKEAAV